MRTTQPQLLAKGHFRPEELNVTLSASNLVVEDDTREQIEKLWVEKEKLAKAEGWNFFNGTSYRLNDIHVENERVHLELAVIDFKTRQMLRDIPEVFDMSEAHYRKGCFSTTTLKTKDDKYLMVKLSGKSTNSNSIDLIGGIMDTDIEMKSGQDVFDQLYAEIEEESFIKKEEIEECTLRAIYLGKGLNVGFYFETNTVLSSEEVKKRFDSSKKDIDIQGLIILDKKQYIETLSNHNQNKKLILSVFTE